MKYFLMPKTYEEFLNSPHTSNKILILDGSCSKLKSKLLEELCVCAKSRGLLLEKFYSPYDYDSICAIYIKKLRYFIIDNDFTDYAPGNSIKIDTDKVFSESINKAEISKNLTKRNILLSNLARAENSARLLFAENKRIMSKYVCKPKILNFVLRFAMRNKLYQSEEIGKCSVRTLSSITAWGVHSFYETIYEHQSNIISLSGPHRNASSILISGLNEMFCQCGYDTTLYKCSLTGDNEHLSIDRLSLAFVTDNDYHTIPYGEAGRIHTNRFINFKIPESAKLQAILNEEQADNFIGDAVFSAFDALEVQNKSSDNLYDLIDEEKKENLTNEIISLVFANN